jgi:GntR family transcriptional regulator
MPLAAPTPLASLLGLVTLDRSSPVPLYFQLAQLLQKAIEDGLVPPGTRLDNEIQLAGELGLSRPTVRRAMQHLIDKGLIVRRRGVGTRVVQPKVRRPLELSSLYEDLAASGQQPTTAVLSHTVEPAGPEVAEALAVDIGTPLVALVRLRSAQGRPIARMANYLPASLLDVDTDALERHGLYQLIRAAGVHLHAATQVIGARSATAEEARLLGESRGAAVLTMQRIAYDDNGSAVEYGRHIYAATRYSFELSLLSS